MWRLTLVFALAAVVTSCSGTLEVQPPAIRASEVRLNPVRSIDGPVAGMTRTLALKNALEKRGFRVVLLTLSQQAPTETYPHLFAAVDHDTLWCLGGVFHYHESQVSKERLFGKPSFELYQQRGNGLAQYSPDECASGLVEQLVRRVRP